MENFYCYFETKNIINIIKLSLYKLKTITNLRSASKKSTFENKNEINKLYTIKSLQAFSDVILTIKSLKILKE